MISYHRGNLLDADVDALVNAVNTVGIMGKGPDLKGLAILDRDGANRQDAQYGALTIIYWRRYEAENYFITPGLLRDFASLHFADLDLFGGFQKEIDEVLEALTLELVFDGIAGDLAAWKQSPPDAARLVWEAKTERRKLSTFAEGFFRRLAHKLGGPMLLKKGELHRLIAHVDPQTIPAEVSQKLDLLDQLFTHATTQEASADAAAD